MTHQIPRHLWTGVVLIICCINQSPCCAFSAKPLANLRQVPARHVPEVSRKCPGNRRRISSIFGSEKSADESAAKVGAHNEAEGSLDAALYKDIYSVRWHRIYSGILLILFGWHRKRGTAKFVPVANTNNCYDFRWPYLLLRPVSSNQHCLL